MTTQDTQAMGTGELVGFSGVARVSHEPQCLPSHVPTHGRYGNIEGPSADAVSDEDDTKMRLCWEGTMCKVMKIPEGYQDVAVLIVKWNERLDELKTKPEVEQLEKVFKERFRYHTRVIELDNFTSKPQHQLNDAITQDLKKFDGPNNLLIVYYTGHALYDENKHHLQLYASSNGAMDYTAKYPASAIWNNGERPLIDDADCDVLAILDTCFASNISKGPQEDGRTYELLAASGYDKMTAGPGLKSFTTALITSLNDLLNEHKDRPFSTRALCENINRLRRGNKQNNQSHILDRLKRYNHSITLAPLKNNLAEREDQFKREPTLSRLTLELPLTVARPTEKQIEEIARALSQAIKKSPDAPVKQINWLKLKKLTTLQDIVMAGVKSRFIARTYVRKWNNIAAHRHNQQSQVTTQDKYIETTPTIEQTAEDSPTLDSPPIRSKSEASPSPRVSLKRKHSSSHGNASTARSKRSSPEQDEQHRMPMTPLSGTET